MLKSCGRILAFPEPSLKEVLLHRKDQKGKFPSIIKRVLLSEQVRKGNFLFLCEMVVPEVAAYPYAPGIAGTHRATDSITAINCFILFFIELSFE